MSVVGAWTCVWQESRYLPLVCEQLERVPGPKVIVWNDSPFFWYGDGSAPSGHASKVGAVLAQFPALPVVKLTGPSDTETLLRNYATKHLRERGAEVALWQDEDFLVDLPEFDRLVATMAADEPRCWTVAARHLWRNWQTTYSRGNFRMGYPTAAEWKDGSFDRKFEETARHCDVTVWHPSYLRPDDEIYRKLHSWFHATLAHEAKWWERWQSREWDLEQDLQPLDLHVPVGILERLRRHGCLEGF